MTDVSVPLRAADILIVGAGPTGLGAAQRLEALGADWALLEASDTAGGLAGSLVDAQGFTWDYGGHVQHSHYDSFDRAMAAALGPDGWLEHRRHSSVWIRGRFVPYPFQQHLHHLDEAECARALDGLRRAARASAPAPPPHFDAWLEASFGTELADLFMRPYNRKVWQYPLDELDRTWVGDRVAVPDVVRLERAVQERRDDDTWGPNATFRYPRRGGTGAPWRAIAASLPPRRVHFGRRVIALDLGRRDVTLADGTRVAFGRLVTTLPLDELLRISGNPAPAWAPDLLRYSSVDVVGVGVAGTPPGHLAERCWMYFPEAASPYFRVTHLSRYSPHNVPVPGQSWSLMAEVASRPGAGAAAADLCRDVPAAMRADGLLPPDARVLSVTHRHCVHGYPTRSSAATPRSSRSSAGSRPTPCSAAGVSAPGSTRCRIRTTASRRDARWPSACMPAATPRSSPRCGPPPS
ncbi:MAG: FAD-dependent oxidoreductase [Vicinamibacterales bacterium]